MALVDADAGIVTIRPLEKQKVIFQKKVADKEHEYSLAPARALDPAVTKDGVTISVLANVGCSADAVEHYFKNASDVIFRLLRPTHDDVPDVPLSLCGELAGRPEHIPRLLQCGIRTFSIAAPSIPIIKETIRNSWCSAPLKRNP